MQFEWLKSIYFVSNLREALAKAITENDDEYAQAIRTELSRRGERE